MINGYPHVFTKTHINLLTGPRVLFSIGRDGLLNAKAALVSEGGTPRVALAVTSMMVVVLILSGTFEQIIALYAVLFLLYYVSAFVAVFVLRHREPGVARPYKAFGYPLSTAIVLAGSIAFLIAAVAEDPRSGLIAAGFLACCGPAYVWMARNRRLQTAMHST
jgi:APA family basic amino acid/polyamine antiporter